MLGLNLSMLVKGSQNEDKIQTVQQSQYRGWWCPVRGNGDGIVKD